MYESEKWHRWLSRDLAAASEAAALQHFRRINEYDIKGISRGGEVKHSDLISPQSHPSENPFCSRLTATQRFISADLTLQAVWLMVSFGKNEEMCCFSIFLTSCYCDFSLCIKPQSVFTLSLFLWKD